MHFIARICVTYAVWKFVRWFDSIQWKSLFSAQRHTAAKPAPLTYETLPKLAGISAGDYFHALRNRRDAKVRHGDLSDSAFAAWRAYNNR